MSFSELLNELRFLANPATQFLDFAKMVDGERRPENQISGTTEIVNGCFVAELARA